MKTDQGHQGSVLLVDDRRDELAAWGDLLKDAGYYVSSATSLRSAKTIMRDAQVQVIVTDLRLGGSIEFPDLGGLHLAKTYGSVIPVIILTGKPTVDAAVLALSPNENDSSVAFAFIDKNDDPQFLLQSVEKAMERYGREAARIQVGGALTDFDAAAYISRKAEHEIGRRLRRMDYILVVEARQQGKTSLVNFLIRNPPFPGALVVLIDIGALDYSAEEVWYESLCEGFHRQLTATMPDLIWPTLPRNHSKWKEFLSALALSLQERGKFLIIALDEIGRLPPGGAGFFSVLRTVYNLRQAEPHLRHVTFMLLGAFHPRDFVVDDKSSPFNVSFRVRLPDFTLAETIELVSRLIPSETEAERLATYVHNWTNGQPYLTQQLCTSLRIGFQADDVERAAEVFRRDDENHIPPLLDNIASYPEGRDYLSELLKGKKVKFRPRENKIQGRLDLLGAISADSEGFTAIRNRLYKEVFETLIEEVGKQKDVGPLKQGADLHHGGSPKVFVLMPFAKSFAERYTLGIKDPLEALGVTCERADELSYIGGIVGKVYEYIRNATIVVADMTGKNANVFYEVGYAHALEKQVILLTEREDDIPIDLRHLRHIIYEGSILRLKADLVQTVKMLLGIKGTTHSDETRT